ncbi:hypothetical protein ACEU6E_05395 [Halorutilales archaeon Cl-col2-1]
MTDTDEEYTGEFGEVKVSSLRVIRDVFVNHEPLVEEAQLDEFDPHELQVYFEDGFEKPGRFDVRWSTRNYFNFHYTEPGEFDFRYDRHPNHHSPEKHFHPPSPQKGERRDPEESCIEVETDRLVALAVIQLWRQAWEADDFSLLNQGNPP